MKKTGDYVLMGQIAGNSTKRFNLFDGKFTTGYRIKEFYLENGSPTDGAEALALLSTREKAVSVNWDWADVTELAWAAFQAPTTNSAEKHYVRPDNMAIEDLYLMVYSTLDNRTFNYMIILEKYEFKDWDGAGILVENNAQAGPQ